MCPGIFIFYRVCPCRVQIEIFLHHTTNVRIKIKQCGCQRLTSWSHFKTAVVRNMFLCWRTARRSWNTYNSTRSTTVGGIDDSINGRQRGTPRTCGVIRCNTGQAIAIGSFWIKCTIDATWFGISVGQSHDLMAVGDLFGTRTCFSTTTCFKDQRPTTAIRVHVAIRCKRILSTRWPDQIWSRITRWKFMKNVFATFSVTPVKTNRFFIASWGWHWTTDHSSTLCYIASCWPRGNWIMGIWNLCWRASWAFWRHFSHF